MSQTKTIDELNEQLAAATTALDQALESGADTTEARYTIGVLENEIAAVVRRQREEHAAAERVQQAAIEEAAVAAAEQAHKAVEAAAVVPGLEGLAGEPLPALERNPQIDIATREIARCRVALERAEAEVKPYAEKVAGLQQRIKDKLTAIDEITSRRIAGDERAGDAGDLDMLRKDNAGLDALLTAAKEEAAAADNRPSARAALQAAEAALAMAHKSADYDAALARVQQAEAVLLEAFGKMVRAGRDAGHNSPWSRWAPSPNLRRAVTGQLVQGASNPFFN